MNDIRTKIEALKVYPEKNIDKVVSDIQNCNSTIKEAVINWLDTQVETNITVEGITYNSLKEICKMNPIAAYLTLDWIFRKRDFALNILKKEYPKLSI